MLENWKGAYGWQASARPEVVKLQPCIVVGAALAMACEAELYALMASCIGVESPTLVLL